jgi:DNA-binding response OmpR family regulator
MACILVVDDDEQVTQTFGQMLQLEGYEVRTAASAETGLLEAEACAPDAILLDLRMPLVDGLEFLRRLRTRATLKATPVAIITGDYLIDDAVIAALRALGARVEFKPLWLEDLVRIASAIVAPGQRREHACQ